MLLNSSPRPYRLTQEVPAIRRKLPYHNYASATIPSHTHPRSDDHPPCTMWTGPRGYGGRHILDEAPFSLWDDAKGDFRLPDSSERNWLVTRYRATAVDFQFPVMLIETADPPDPLPLTVAAVATKFVPPPSETVDRNAGGMRLRPLHDARPLQFTTDYAGMRGPEDPLQFTFRRWVQPIDEELKSLVRALFRFCNPRMVHILCPYIIVELCCEDQRTYEPGSMPRRMGGYSVHYHHSVESVFQGLSMRGRQRLISPHASIQDTSNYLDLFDELCPGVRVSSGTVTDSDSSAEASMSTTAGILVRDTHGHQRLTVSNHGFLHSKEVFHPSDSGTQIGEIDERWEHLDIALVRLYPSVQFTNSTYFEAKVPRRLLRAHEIPNGAFFSVDGMSTGVVFMQAQGLTLDIPPRPRDMNEIDFFKMRIYRGFGALGTVPREGICGAAFVEDDSEEGGVAGFFQNGNADYALSPCLDELIDQSWNIV